MRAAFERFPSENRSSIESPSAIGQKSPSTFDILIFGPERSCRIAIDAPISAETLRTSRRTASCSSWLPWEKLSRKTLAPASIRLFIFSGPRDEGPRVATIFVRRSL